MLGFFFGNWKSILKTFSHCYSSPKMYLVGCQCMNDVTEYKVIMRVRLICLKMVFEEKQTFQVFILSESSFFPKKKVILNVKRPVLCVKRNPLSTVHAAVSSSAG